MKKQTRKTAIISGASSGIGRAVAIRLLEDNWNIIGFSYDKLDCRALQQTLQRSYNSNRFLILVADVTKLSQMKRMVQQANKKFGTLDAVINSAGIGYYSDCDTIDARALTRMVDINICGVMNLTAAVVKIMKRQKSGLVINIVSTAGKSVSAHGVFYGATKFAIMGYSEGIRRELKPFGIRVTTVCPGLTKTAFLTAAQIAYRKKHIWKETVPLMLSVDDVSGAVSFICSQPDSVIVEDLTVRPF